MPSPDVTLHVRSVRHHVRNVLFEGGEPDGAPALRVDADEHGIGLRTPPLARSIVNEEPEIARTEPCERARYRSVEVLGFFRPERLSRNEIETRHSVARSVRPEERSTAGHAELTRQAPA